MSTESPAFATVGARRQLENVLRKLEAVRRTLKELQEMPAPLTSVLDRAEDLQRATENLMARMNRTWQAFQAPLREAERALQPVKQNYENVEQRARRAAQQTKQLEAQLANLRQAARAAPENQQVKQQVASHEEQLQAATVSQQSLEATLRQVSEEHALARTAHQDATAALEKVAESPLAEFDAARQEADKLNEDANHLYDEGTKERTLAATRTVITSNTNQFESAMKHHRQQALLLLVVTGITVGLLGWSIFHVFQLGHAVDPHRMESGRIAMAAPTKAPPAATPPAANSTDWAHVLMTFGGRISVVAGAAWIVVFLGRLHARHAQQAVSYQDRLAGLDMIGLLLQTGTQATREKTLERMTNFYLTQEDNAFREPTSREPNLKEVSKMLTTLTDPLVKTVNSIARGIERNKG